MKIAGQALLGAPCAAIWPLIFEPEALLQLLPGCEEIVQVAPGEYRGRMSLRVPALAGAYDVHVRVLDAEPSRSCRIEGDACGANGSVQGQAGFTLQPEGEGTRIVYQGDALISGPLAGLNPRFAEGVAQTLIRQGLNKLPELARERATAQAAADREGLAASVPAAPHSISWPLGLRAIYRQWLAAVKRYVLSRLKLGKATQ
jgi:carbon monoxide dehydrogenase subunit G